MALPAVGFVATSSSDKSVSATTTPAWDLDRYIAAQDAARVFTDWQKRVLDLADQHPDFGSARIACEAAVSHQATWSFRNLYRPEHKLLVGIEEEATAGLDNWVPDGYIPYVPELDEAQI